MTESNKIDRKDSTDQKAAQSRDPRAPKGDIAKNELTDDALQDVTGGCATGEHMPKA